MSENPLRGLPKMDVLLACPRLAATRAQLPHSLLRDAAREVLASLRAQLQTGALAAPPEPEELARLVEEAARALLRPSLRRVVNATGVVLHTNLGRAPLAPEAAQAARDAALGYTNLEYDLDWGSRGSRHAHVEDLLCRLTGAEAAACFNNNAAAVLLMLCALCGGKTVAVSRGELVEIGGSFRVPDIMARSGAVLREVGATNKTRLADYEEAVRAGAGALLKVHTSNYRIVGFTEETSLEALSGLGRAHGLPVLYDLGSGALSPDRLPRGLSGPTAAEALKAGADVVCFSADKLLGGPQAGIAVGRRAYIEAMKKDPLARALRIDKLSLAALEATLRLSLDPEQAKKRVPVLAMLDGDEDALRQRAERLAAGLGPLLGAGYSVAAIPTEGAVGGGALPALPLPGWAAAIVPADGRPEALEAALRRREVPILGRIQKGALLLDARTLTDGDCEEILRAAEEL